MDKGSRISWSILRIACVLSILDMCFIMIYQDPSYNYAWISASLRPIYLLFSIRMLRENCISYFFVVKDTVAMVLFIIIYIMYFAWMGQRLFSGTLEGIQFFGSFQDAFFNMLVLMTTSNFPDIMLPAYQRSRLNCLYFIIYLILGLFLMMNLLLAIFYSNFKNRFERKLLKSEQRRSDYLYSMFQELAQGKDHLNQQELYLMFVRIHGLATLTDQDLKQSDLESLSTPKEFASRRTTMKAQSKKVDIQYKQFEYIFGNRIKPNLADPAKFRWNDLNLLLNAYEFWRFENKQKINF